MHALYFQRVRRCRDEQQAAVTMHVTSLSHPDMVTLGDAGCHTCFAAPHGTPSSTPSTRLHPPCRGGGSMSGLAEPVPARSCGSATACGVCCSASLVLPRHARLLTLCILSAFAHLHPTSLLAQGVVPKQRLHAVVLAQSCIALSPVSCDPTCCCACPESQCLVSREL